MKAIITGASGFIGNRLCERLLRGGWIIKGVSRTEPSDSLLGHPNFEWIERDLVNKGFEKRETENVDVLFHLAGATLGKGNKVNTFFKTNECITLNILNTMYSIPKIIFTSSQVVYGIGNNLNIDEQESLDGHYSPYAISKINCENWLKYFQFKTRNSTTILRLTGFIEDPGSFIRFVLDRAFSNDTIELYSKGNVCRDYLSINDCIDVLVKSCENQKEDYRVYNIGSGNTINALSVTKLICGKIGSESSIVLVDKPASIEKFCFNIDKARRELGFSPSPIIQSVEKYIEKEMDRWKRK